MPSTPEAPCQRRLNILLLAVIAALYLVYYPWFMYHNLPTVEGMFHLNSQSPAEAWQTAVKGWQTANSRVGEFCAYFMYAVPLHVVLSIIHPLFMLLLAAAIQRLGTGVYPRCNTPSLLTFLYISFFVATASPVTEWWLDNLNWVYPCGVAMLFFAIAAPLLRGERIGLGRFCLLLLLLPITAMGNEILAITTPLLFIGACGLKWLKEGRFLTGSHYLIIAALLVGCSVFFFSSPCWSARMEVCGFSAGPMDRLKPIIEPERYLILFCPTFALILLITLIGYALGFIFRQQEQAESTRDQNSRLNLLLLIGIGYLLLTLVIPGYHPHREYRCLQFFIICIATAMLARTLIRPWGTKVAGLMLLPVGALALHYMSAQMMDTRVRMQLLNTIRELGQQQATTDGYLYLSSTQWNEIVTEAHRFNGCLVPSTLECDRLVLKATEKPNPETLQTHRPAITLYSNFEPEEQTHILLSCNIPTTMLHKASPDILLNRPLAAQVGLRGIIVTEEAVPAPPPSADATP